MSFESCKYFIYYTFSPCIFITLLQAYAMFLRATLTRVLGMCRCALTTQPGNLSSLFNAYKCFKLINEMASFVQV